MNLKALIVIGVLVEAAVVLGEYEKGRSPKSAAVSRKISDVNYFRLPNDIIPKAYNLKIVPVMQVGNFSFTGTVNITIYVRNSTKSITMHTKGLNVTQHSLSVYGSPWANISMVNATDFADRDFHVLYLKNNLTKGSTYILTMDFKGKLQEDLDGFYICSYKNKIGKTEWMAVTQFESISARKAFPCFDEPRFKANFTVSIARPQNMSTLSNMPKASNATNSPGLPPGYVLDTYKTSPKMSTYLVAFAVSNFSPNPTGANETFRVMARANAIDQTAYSVEVGPKILEKMAAITNINYTLPKMDLLAVPDFAAGAMENWGLVTFRETDLLFLNESSTNYDKQQVFTVVAHELSHQWFGDLVTLEWWSNLWLDEGFAEYWMYVVPDLMEPTWRLMEQFVLDNMQTPFISDAMEDTKPIVHPVIDPNIGDYQSSDITYGKAASVIRMMEHVLTRDVFFRGLRRYLNQRKFSWANQSMLFDAIQAEASGAGGLPPFTTVSDVWTSWTTQSGYPVVTVERMYAEGKAIIGQKRFVLEDFDHNFDQGWWIPLTFTSEVTKDFNATRPREWLSPGEEQIVVSGLPPNSSWVIFNLQATGFYRVNYDKRNWDLIISYLNSRNYTKIHPVNRGQLLDDALSLARGGYINYTLALNLSEYLSQETDFIPWYSAYNLFDFLDMMMSQTDYYVNFKYFMQDLLTDQYRKLSFNESSSDDHVTRLSRSMLLPKACKYNVMNCSKEALQYFQSWNETGVNKIPPNLRSAVYCYGVISRGQKAWNFLWSAYAKASVASERQRILEALACSEDENILKGYLQKTLDSGSIIPLQDRGTVFKYVYSRAKGLSVALNFLTVRFQDIVKQFGANTANKIILGISSRISSSEDNLMMFEFLAQNIDRIDADVAGKSKKYITSNINWIGNYGETVGAWLNAKYPTSSQTVTRASTVVIALATILRSCLL